jgi:hypothetical protein
MKGFHCDNSIQGILAHVDIEVNEITKPMLSWRTLSKWRWMEIAMIII